MAEPQPHKTYTFTTTVQQVGFRRREKVLAPDEFTVAVDYSDGQGDRYVCKAISVPGAELETAVSTVIAEVIRRLSVPPTTPL